MIYGRNNPTNLDSIILKSARSNEDNNLAHNFKTKFNTPRDGSFINVLEEVKKNNYLLSPRNDTYEGIKIDSNSPRESSFNPRNRSSLEEKF